MRPQLRGIPPLSKGVGQLYPAPHDTTLHIYTIKGTSVPHNKKKKKKYLFLSV